jgi:hypothetical protein
VLVGEDIAPGRSTGAVSIRDLYTTILEAASVGDPNALREGRRDLRAPSEARRVVEIERRSYGKKVRDMVAAHAGAASDGKWLVVSNSDGKPTVRPRKRAQRFTGTRRRASASGFESGRAIVAEFRPRHGGGTARARLREIAFLWTVRGGEPSAGGLSPLFRAT